MTPSQTINYIQFQDIKKEALTGETIVETPVSLTVNGDDWLTFMCTPIQLEEMAIGFLYNEAIISSKDELADVRVCEHGDNVDVWLNHAAEKPTKWRRTSGCTGGVTAVDLLSDGLPVVPPTREILSPKQISTLVGLLFESQALYKETGGVHTSVLSDGENIILTAEDIGRHNTLDKIAGALLRTELDLSHRIIITTGRISSEMLQKAARLNVEVLISRTSPSSLSIELAEKTGVTLIGYARRNRFNVYAHPQRITP
jgi:FdhD protein